VEGTVAVATGKRPDGDSTPWAAAVRYYAGAAGQGFGGDSPQAERRIDSSVLPQAGRASRNEQRHGAAHLAQGRSEATSIGALYGQRRPGVRTETGRHHWPVSTSRNMRRCSVDEKSAIQALDRLDPVLPMSPDEPSVTASNTTVTARSRYTPHCMFAAERFMARQQPVTPVTNLSIFSIKSSGCANPDRTST